MEGGARPNFQIVAANTLTVLDWRGAEIDFIAPRSGPLFLKINNPPGQLRECRGAIRVQIVHDESVELSPSEK